MVLVLLNSNRKGNYSMEGDFHWTNNFIKFWPYSTCLFSMLQTTHQSHSLVLGVKESLEMVICRELREISEPGALL